MKYRTTEMLVGAFMLVGVAIILIGIFMIRGLGTAGLVEYHALYSNAAGVEAGTAVKYNGMLVGRVKQLRIDDDDRTKVRVTFVVRDDTPVTARTLAKITKADILGDPYVDLHVLESESGSSVRLDDPGDILPPRSRVLAGEPFDLQATLDDAAAAIESLSALASLVKRQVEAVIEDVRRVLETAQRLLSEENRARVEETLARLAETAREVEALVAENRERFDGILRNAEATTGNLEEASAQLDRSLDTMLPKAEGLIDTADRTLADVRSLVASTDASISSLDAQRINDVLENIEATTRNLAEFSRELKDRPYRLIRTEKREPGDARFK